MVVSEASSGGGHCGWAREVVPGATTSPCPVHQSLLPLEDAFIAKQNEWVTSRAQQQLLWDTLQSIKDRAAHAFLPIAVGQPTDPFRETYNDGGLYGAGCNYAVGFHGIQGRQAKCEDYVLHLALGPELFAPFDDCTRACLACVLDGHGGTGAVQYVAERFPAYLLGDLPRLRARPAAAMRAALHRIDEELTSLGHNSGTTVNAFVLIDNRITVVNTGDCRCILYDWVDERAEQVTHDHNLLSDRERERVKGAGAELSGCGAYVVLPCPTDGSKLLGVTKALGHAGVKALQRSYTVGSLSGILETELSGGDDKQQGQQQPQDSLQTFQDANTAPELPAAAAPVAQSADASERLGGVAASAQGEGSVEEGAGAPAEGRGPEAAAAPVSAGRAVSSSCLSTSSLWGDLPGGCSSYGMAGTGPSAGGVASGSGMSEDFPALSDPPMQCGAGAGAGVHHHDVDMCGSCVAVGVSCPGVQNGGARLPDGLRGQAVRELEEGAEDPKLAGLQSGSALCGRVTARTSPQPSAPAQPAGSPSSAMAAPQRCCSCRGSDHLVEGSSRVPTLRPLPQSSFATPAAAALAAAVAADPLGRSASGQDPLCPVTSASAIPSPGALGGPVASSSGFLLTCEPDEFEFTVEDDRHLLLLGCDGVFDRMNNTEACRTAVRQLTASNSCVDAAREVAHRACRLGSLDNITALVLRLGRKPITRRQSFSVLRRSSSNTSGDLAASGGSVTSRA